jgi:glycosyltransferase involved in cell wall biosynthesis
MKIILATTTVPFVKGGANIMFDTLAQKMREYGHETAEIRIPFISADSSKMMEQMLAIRLLDVTRHGDRLICIRTPSYLLRHPNKILWFIHHHRAAYDLWDTKYGMKHANFGTAYREFFIRADELAFKESKKIFANSEEMRSRLKSYNNVDSTVLYPPLLEPEKFFCDSYGDYIYYPSRICTIKRQNIAAEAMKYTKTPVKLIISGAYDLEIYREQLQPILKGSEEKITIIDRWISEEEKRELFSKCLAVCYIPLLEDSYGYVSLEAAHSKKTVISCVDSGGTKELINHGINGFLAESNPQALAEIFDELYLDKQKAERLGQAMNERLNELKIDWDTVIGGLTS